MESVLRGDGSLSEPGGNSKVGQRVGRYEIRRKVGSGATGTVCAVFDPELNREIAIKMLRPGGNPTERAWLLREARAMARLSHPNVVGVLDVGDVDDQIFI